MSTPPPVRPRLALIAAVARNGTIGHGNALLWHLPEDMKHFRTTTAGAPVVMGRKTWDSLPERFRPLPGRHNIVVTRQTDWQAAGATVADSLPAALAAAAQTAPAAERVWIIGGATLYAEALPVADELVLTELDRDYDGDTRFPAWSRDDFAETRRETVRAAAPNDFDLAFVHYERRPAPTDGSPR